MMISAISDVHVKTPHDEADRLLMSFLDHPKVRRSDSILLLGDIFDLMCGPHDEYLSDFSHIFKKIDDLIKSGKRVYFSEGNHDVHLAALFKKIWPHGELTPHQDPVIENIQGKTYYFSHGDEHEVDNLSYQRYKSLIMSPPLRFVANHLMPYWLLNFIGNRASKMSRKKGSRIFNEELVRERFRAGVSQVTQGKYDFVIGGHSHVRDNYEMNEGGTYINNGYALRSKSFILIQDHHVSFESLA